MMFEEFEPPTDEVDLAFVLWLISAAAIAIVGALL